MANTGFAGLDQMTDLMNKLQQMGASLNSTIKDEALRKGAEVTKERIENHPNIPVSSRNKEHARDNIEIRKISDDQYDIGATNKFFYLLFHEIGTTGSTYVAKDGRTYTSPSLPAKPFMRPAFENSQRDIEKEMMKVIKREFGL